MFVLNNQTVSDSLDETLDKYNKIEILEEKEPNKDYLEKVIFLIKIIHSKLDLLCILGESY